ncbi:hypothetical protein LZ31DRAFT_549301 [Colletotrichum somersetense]|nr:hypothetical protein LZ31DRAFT_549301 [Colletotrichum somersetense]
MVGTRIKQSLWQLAQHLLAYVAWSLLCEPVWEEPARNVALKVFMVNMTMQDKCHRHATTVGSPATREVKFQRRPVTPGCLPRTGGGNKQWRGDSVSRWAHGGAWEILSA